jgi:hypothetical protein
MTKKKKVEGVRTRAKEVFEEKSKISKEFVAGFLVVVVVLVTVIFYFREANEDKTDKTIERVQSQISKIDTEFTNNHRKNLDDRAYVKALLDHLVHRDQYTRQELVKKVLKDTNGDVELAGYNKQKILDYIKKVDTQNVVSLNEVLDKYIWPKISEFDTKADVDAWIIVQHADFDLPLQHKTLFILDQYSQMNETNKTNYAILYDRVAVKYKDIGIKQKFGTQGKVTDGKFQVFDYVGNEKELNQRRQELGFPPIQEFVEAMNKKLEAQTKIES